jgi:hypothetical protein
MMIGRCRVSEYGVTSYTPPDATARLATALNGAAWTGRHADHVPAFTGRPMGAEDSPIPPVLDQLANVQEAPAPEPPAPTLAETVDAAKGALATVITMLERLTPQEWDGGD